MALVPKVDIFAATETCFAKSARMVGLATMVAFFFVASLRIGTMVSFVVIGFIGEAKFRVTALIVVFFGCLLIVGLVRFSKVGIAVLSSWSWWRRPLSGAVSIVTAISFIVLESISLRRWSLSLNVLVFCAEITS